MLHILDNGTLRLNSTFAMARKLKFMCEFLIASAMAWLKGKPKQHQRKEVTLHHCTPMRAREIQTHAAIFT